MSRMTARRMIGLVSGAALLLVAAVPLSGCGTAAADKESPYHEEIQRTLEHTDNDMVKSILADEKITDAEVNEIMEAYNECLAPYGLKNTYNRAEQYESIVDQFNQYSPEENQKINDKCRKKSGYYDIIPLDQSMQTNPRNMSQDKLSQKIYECRKRHGLIDKGMTFKEYQEMDANPSTGPFYKYYNESSPEATQWRDCGIKPES